MNNLSKLILKGLIFTILLSPLTFVYLDLENEQNVIKMTMDYAFHQAKTSSSIQDDIVFLGDSRLISGIDMDYLQGKRSFEFTNLSIGGSSFLESYYLLKYYLETHPKPKTVFLSYVPSIHFFKPSILGHFGLPSVFQLHPLDLIESGQLSNYFVNNLNRNKDYLWRLMKTAVHQDTLRINRPFPFFGGTTALEIKEIYTSHHGFVIWARSQTQVDQHREPFYWDREAKEQNKKIDPVEKKYFTRIISLCNQHHIQTACILMPIHESSEDIYKSYVYPIWMEYIDSLPIQILDCQPKYWKYTDFVDPSHLNQTGRRRYNEYLIDSGLLDRMIFFKD